VTLGDLGRTANGKVGDLPPRRRHEAIVAGSAGRAWRPAARH